MGLVLKPAELKNAAQQMRANIADNKTGYSNALQVIGRFAENEQLDSQSWNTAKFSMSTAHQLITQGMQAAQEAIEQDLSTLEANAGDEELDEDQLIEDIEKLTNECICYEEAIRNLQKMAAIAILSGYAGIQKAIERYKQLLEMTKVILEIMKAKLNHLIEISQVTSGLLILSVPLLQAIECAINDAEVYITGTGTLSNGEWRTAIPEIIEDIADNKLDEVLQKELDIDLETFKELYGEEKVKEIQQSILENNVCINDEGYSQKIVVNVLEQLSGCSVDVVNDKFQFKAGESTVIHEYSLEKIQEKLKEGNENSNWENTEVIIPETVTGIVSGSRVEFHPFENWGAPGKGKYKQGVQKDENGRYKIAVAPRILDPDYPDDGKIWGDDFNDFSNRINVVLEDINTGEERIVECVVVDQKAHSYNKYPCETGDIATLNVENGLIQTGIAYPQSANAKKGDTYVPSTMAGSVIEFAGHEVDFNISQYKMKEIIIVEE